MYEEMFRELVRSKVAPAGTQVGTLSLTARLAKALWKSDQSIVVTKL